MKISLPDGLRLVMGSPPNLNEEAGRQGRVHALLNEDLVTPSNVVELQLLLAAKYIFLPGASETWPLCFLEGGLPEL
jgi:hypothetical protein